MARRRKEGYTGGIIKVRALKSPQVEGRSIFCFFLRGQDILEVADISRLRRDGRGVLLGYQRGVVKRHIREIADYLNSDDVLFPNAIILALSSSVQFKKSRGPSAKNSESLAGWLEIPVGSQGQKSAWIVDGQQRTVALIESERQEMEVPVTAFVSDDFDTHRAQFLLVNKAKPLPRGLIHELLPAVNTCLPPSLAKSRVPSALCDILNRDPESPLYGLLVRNSTDRKAHPEAVVADNSMIQVIRSSMNSPHGCLYVHQNLATGEFDHQTALACLKVYWQGVREIFPEAWGLPPAKSRLMHGVGIKSMGILMDHVMSRIPPHAEDAVERVKAALEPVRPHCAWTEGNWALLGGMEWNHLQNTASHVKLLANMLVRVFLGVHEG